MAGGTGAQAVGFLHGATAWVSGAVITNPTTGLTIVDTGPLTTAANYLFAVTGSCDASWTYEVRHLDVGLATLHAVRRIPAAGNDDLLFPNKIRLENNERLRVVCIANATANVQLSIFWIEVG
jgi:hypothetical protein